MSYIYFYARKKIQTDLDKLTLGKNLQCVQFEIDFPKLTEKA